MTAGGHTQPGDNQDHDLNEDEEEPNTNTEPEFNMIEDQEYLLLMSTMVRAQMIPENPVVAGKFVSKVINLHNQAATVPEAPAKTSHTELDGEIEQLAHQTDSVPDTELTLNHIIPAEVVIKQPIRNTLRVTFLVILACKKLKQMISGGLRLMAHASPLCAGLIKPAALDSLNLLIGSPNNRKPSRMGQSLARPTHGLFGGSARMETDKFWPFP